MKMKSLAIVGFSLLMICAVRSSAEARSFFSFSFGNVFAEPVCQERIVEYYPAPVVYQAPVVYAAPVYGPMPYARPVVYAAPVGGYYREVYTAPRVPVGRRHVGFSMGFGR